MMKILTYQEANTILGSSLTPLNRCIDKTTAIANGADPTPLANFEYNRLIPVDKLDPSITNVYYTITFKDWDGTVLSGPDQVLENTMPVVPTNPTRSGYTFTGWSPTVAIATLDLIYTATYTQDNPTPATYTLTIIASGNGSASYNSQSTRNTTNTYSVSGGTSVTVSFSADSGYHISAVTVNGTSIGTSSSTTQTVNANMTISVTFAQDTVTTYTIRFLDYDNTVLKTLNLAAGATPTPPASPTRSGYTFSGWNPAVSTVSGDLDYVATYTANTYSYNQTIGAAYVSQSSSLESIPLIVEPYMMSWPTGKTVTINASGWVGTESSHTSVSGTITISFNGATSTTATVSGTLANYLEFESATSADGVKFRMINPSAETGVMITSYSMNTYITKNPSESSGWKNEHTNIEELPDFYSKIVIAASQAA